MRFCHITTYYPEFLKSLYKKRSDLITKSYAEQIRSILDEYFAWSDTYCDCLTKLGYETCLPIANCEHIQKQWAVENGVSIDSDWKNKIVRAQLKKFRPDILYFEDSYFHSPDFVNELRAELSCIKLTVSHYGTVKIGGLFKTADLIIGCADSITDKLKEKGSNAYTIYNAFDYRILDKLKTLEPLDISFVGSFIPGIHQRRHELIRHLVENKFRIAVYSNSQSRFSLRSLARSVLQNNLIPYIKSLIHDIKCHPEVFGLDMYNVFLNSKVSLNAHGDEVDFAANMRLFEATGCGTCLLTDWKSDLNKLYEIDKEIIAFRDKNDCMEKLNWLLNNDSARKSIAKAGQSRTLRDHAFMNRAQRLDEIMKKELKAKA